jgi:hypothetical protein
MRENIGKVEIDTSKEGSNEIALVYLGLDLTSPDGSSSSDSLSRSTQYNET